VTFAFPSPLASLAWSLTRYDHLLAQKDNLLNQANGLISYLGFLAARSSGVALDEKFRRPSLGHWVGLIRQVLSNQEVDWPLASLRSAIPNPKDLMATLDKTVELRNPVGHGPAPEEGVVLHTWIKEMSNCIQRLCRNLLGLARFALVAVEDLDYREDDNQFLLTARRLEGRSVESRTIQIARTEPCAKGRVYIAAGDFSRLHSLYPWVILAKCPLCYQRELFFYVAADDGSIRYVTPDRGHVWSCPIPSNFENFVRARGSSQADAGIPPSSAASSPRVPETSLSRPGS
jgi:hypothetical protein